jgi:hypothetical protein
MSGAALAPAALLLGLAAAGDPLSEAEISARVATISTELAGRRGVRLKSKVDVELRSRDALAEATDPAAGGDDERDRAALLSLLGIGTPAPGAVATAPPAGAAAPAPGGRLEVQGYYDPTKRRLYVGDFIDLSASRFALTRDVAHAVLDQRFGLGKHLRAAAPGRALPAATAAAPSDTRWAREALVEGDATVQALELIDPEGLLPGRRELAALSAEVESAILAESAGAAPIDVARRLFVYLDGLQLVAGVRATSPWAAVDALWAHPPETTEQVLHPDKYRRHEPADRVGDRLPGTLRGGWRAVQRDTLGELGARVFLARALDPDRVYRGAAGWGGDQAVLYRRGPPDHKHGNPGRVPKPSRDGLDGQARLPRHERPEKRRGRTGGGERDDGAAAPLAAWVTTWDREVDADDFARLGARVLAALAGARPETVGSGRVRLADAGGRLYVAERRGRTVVMLLSAPPGAAADAILRELLAAAARSADKPRRR